MSGMARSGSFALPPAEELRGRIYEQMRRRGTTLDGQRLWTEAEVEILQQYAPDYDAIQQKLKGRTYEAIRKKSNKMGLSKRVHVWSAAEIAKLRRLYRSASKDEIFAEFPFSTWSMITNAANRYRIFRPRAPYKKSKHAIMNAILDRCVAIGWTVADLDSECQTGRYFRDRSWRRNKPKPSAVLKAIEVLGGKVSVKWDE